MTFSIARVAALAVALCGAIQVSAAPVEAPRLISRAGASVVTKCSVPNTVALTFDDGPYTWTNELVDLLDENGAKGVIVGCIYDDANAKRVKYVYDKGHQVASHTWRHERLSTLSGDELLSEFSKTDDAIKKITGAVPAFVRPPFGDYDDDVLEVAASRGQTVANWDFDSGDAAGVSSRSQYNKLIMSGPDSILTLNHETKPKCVHRLVVEYGTNAISSSEDVIPYAIQQIKAKGYKLVTVAECLGESPYQSTGTPSSRDVSENDTLAPNPQC
ncbi:carbohydrate esterase family 4 protein [Rhizoctonia solani AG-1 IA]|uniref:Carbohydrate esterase family 4 protein n=1 Tax=Thanatephorus cucumeris (strain AG1-IA) TaxID=983506 RepID=L8WM74_THACA|nr:carbohydrate esterase family 4 protein [Rhizoctonia solani AG-1 IA]